MCDGMIRFTAKQAKAVSDQEEPILIETLEDLDGYCYYVAGTVGHLLCKLFALHSNLIGVKRAHALNALSVSFGLGLQLTNILKDINEDAKRNVSYIPLSLLAQEHLSDLSFLSPEGRQGRERIMVQLIQKAKGHLEDALEYTCLLPRLEPRLRLFCLWPLFMAAESIVLIAHNLEAKQGETSHKISRARVKRIVGKTSLVCWSNSLIRHMFHSTLESLESSLEKFTATLPSPSKPGLASGVVRP
jgi:farnesyl-diphosphate farnesyltransferase